MRVRLNGGSSSQSRLTSSRSNASDWPPPLLNNFASPGLRSQHLSSPDGEHSPNHDHMNEPEGNVRLEEMWHAAFQESENEPENTQESRNVDHLLLIEFNPLGQPVGDSANPYATKVGKISKSIVSPSYTNWRKVPWELKEEVWRAIKNV
ncbi:hypothetical protein MKX01_000127 [Papaver californicum]|nr:hypothetical protein MKX01_000127 [Papaver californicum]